MPTGSSHKTQNQSKTNENASTVAVALTLSHFWAWLDKCSVSIVTAKSSRKRVMAEAPMKHKKTTE